MASRKLPDNVPPIGLCREAAAQFVGVSPCTFDKGVEARLFPPAKILRGRRIWSRSELERSFHELPTGTAEKIPYGELAGWD